MQIESGFKPVYTFYMRGLTPDIKAGRTLLLTLGRIKNGRPCSYVAQQQSEGFVGNLVRVTDTGAAFRGLQEQACVPHCLKAVPAHSEIMLEFAVSSYDARKECGHSFSCPGVSYDGTCVNNTAGQKRRCGQQPFPIH